VAKITDCEREFAYQYVITGNPARAYRKAFEKMIRQRKLEPAQFDRFGIKLLAKANVQHFIAELRCKLSGSIAFDFHDLIADCVAIATADPNELVSVRRTCCRYCWGVEHEYQWDSVVQFMKALQEADSEREALLVKHPEMEGNLMPLPNDAGGYGFNPTLDPAHDCPHCRGEGVVSVHVADTRYLSYGARKLYAGAKYDKNGNIEVMMHDQQKARETLLRLLGSSGVIKNINGVTSDETEQKYQVVINGAPILQDIEYRDPIATPTQGAIADRVDVK
jgi:phage terminase small subunit